MDEMWAAMQAMMSSWGPAAAPAQSWAPPAPYEKSEAQKRREEKQKQQEEAEKRYAQKHKGPMPPVDWLTIASDSRVAQMGCPAIIPALEFDKEKEIFSDAHKILQDFFDVELIK